MTLINILNKAFAQYGLPEKIISDNGPLFTSTAVVNYMKSKKIIHHKITPLWPRANGEVERFKQPLSKVIKASYIDQIHWETAVHQFLQSYRLTPHSATKVAKG